MNLSKKCNAKSNSFLVIDATLASDNPLLIIIIIDDRITDEKLQYNINREAAKLSTLSSGKIDQYEYLTGEEILLYNQGQIIEQDKLAYSPIGKAFEKQTGKNRFML